MIDFTKVPNIHYWTQRVLPCVFDESLSYVEKINKLEEEINKLIEEYNTFGQNVVTAPIPAGGRSHNRNCRTPAGTEKMCPDTLRCGMCCHWC